MIGVVTFHPESQYIGGAQVPSIAFLKWCNILGLEAKLIGYGDTKEINQCDWVFFGTPGRIQNLGGFYTIPENITIPYVVMVHGEYDDEIYADFSDWVSNYNCKLVVHIDYNSSHWSFKKPTTYWHPCTLPEYLLKPEHVFNNTNRSGLVYAARISHKKGIGKLLSHSDKDWFQKAVQHHIVITGSNYNNISIPKGKYQVINNGFDVYNIKEMEQFYSSFQYFWDVSGNDLYPMPMGRLNLAAIEAIRFGCVPIVNRKTEYSFSSNFTVDLNGGFPNNYLEFQEHMRQSVLASPISYAAVKEQVQTIIEVMK